MSKQLLNLIDQSIFPTELPAMTDFQGKTYQYKDFARRSTGCTTFSGRPVRGGQDLLCGKNSPTGHCSCHPPTEGGRHPMSSTRIACSSSDHSDSKIFFRMSIWKELEQKVPRWRRSSRSTTFTAHHHLRDAAILAANARSFLKTSMPGVLRERHLLPYRQA